MKHHTTYAIFSEAVSEYTCLHTVSYAATFWPKSCILDWLLYIYSKNIKYNFAVSMNYCIEMTVNRNVA